MRVKNIILFLLMMMPVVLFAQGKDRGIHVIDSLESEIARTPDTKSTKGLLLVNIAMVYKERGSDNKAIEYYLKAMRVFEAQGNKNAQARVAGNIGSIYLGMVADPAKKETVSPINERAYLRKAIDYLNKSISLANENNYNNILDMYGKDLVIAMKMLKENTAAADEQQNNEDNKHATDDGSKVAMVNAGIQEDAGNNKLSKQILSNDKERWYYIGGISVLVVVLLIVIFAMYWIYNKQKNVNAIVSTEKKKAEELLLNILPGQVAAELQSKGMVHPQQFDNVTVILTDFVGFTTAAERFSAKQLVGEIHSCFKSFDGILDKYNVEKIKTIGDAYLAIAGAPVADANHAVNAVSVALKMRDFMLYRKKQIGDATFEMRIGVHTGSVIAGIVGTKKFAYDIWGDTVNLAARMEQNSEPGKVNISESTYNLVKHKFRCEHRGEIQAKNKGKLNMYYVLDEI